MAKVRLTLRRWLDDREATREEPHAILASGVGDWTFVDDIECPEGADLVFENRGFVTVTIGSPPPDLRALYADPASYLEGTDDTKLVLPVTELVFEGPCVSTVTVL